MQPPRAALPDKGGQHPLAIPIVPKLLPATKNGRISANYDGRKDVLSDLATDHHVTRREAAEALKARNIPAQGKQR